MRNAPHEVLGLPENASPAEVRSRYRELAKRYHPDTNGGDPTAEWIFKEIQQAHEALQAKPADKAGHEPRRRQQPKPARPRDDRDGKRWTRPTTDRWEERWAAYERRTEAEAKKTRAELWGTLGIATFVATTLLMEAVAGTTILTGAAIGAGCATAWEVWRARRRTRRTKQERKAGR